jgi:MATE family multidrug resistance protein
MGARTPDTAERAAYSGIKITVAYAGTLGLAYLLLPEPFVRAFVPAGQAAAFAAVIPLARAMLRLAALYVISDALAIVFGGALRGVGDTRWCMWTSVSMHWLMASCGYVMIRHTDATPLQVWTGFVAVVMLMGTVYYLRFRKGKWKSIRVLDDEVLQQKALATLPAGHPEQIAE